MKPIKKFSAASNGSLSILESANLSPEALAELVQKLGYNNIDEIKKEKALLSKLEALLKEFSPKQDVSEDDAEDIENEINDLGEPKSLEDKEGEKEEDKEVGSTTAEVAEEADEEEGEEEGEKTEDASKEIEDSIVDLGEPEDKEEEEGEEVVTKDQDITAEVPGEGDDEESGKEVEEEAEEKPVAKRRIMTFEDFVKEEEVTVNKNVSYQDDEEEDEDNAVPVADSVEVETEEEEVEENVSRAASSIKSFSQFVSESYLSEEADNGPELKEETPDQNGIALPIAKGDGPKTAAAVSAETMKMGEPEEKDEKEGEELVTKDQEITEVPATSKDEPAVQGTVVVKETFTFADAIDNNGEDLKKEEKGIVNALKALKANKADEISIMVDTTEEEGEGLYDEIKKMKPLSINSSIYDKAYVGKYNGKDVVVFDSDGDLFAYVKESAISEKEIKSDAEFAEYATELLKSAHGDKFDEAKAKEVIDGLTSKYKGDYGAMVGALQSTMGK